MKEEKILNVGWDMVLKVSVLAMFLYFLYLVQDFVIWFIFALILSILFNFSIDFLEKKKIPRMIGAVIVYVGFLTLIAFFFYKTAPLLIKEIKRDPDAGIGKPEKLKNAFAGYSSRRINDEHRIVYEVMEGDLIIVQLRYHY